MLTDQTFHLFAKAYILPQSATEPGCGVRVKGQDGVVCIGRWHAFHYRVVRAEQRRIPDQIATLGFVRKQPAERRSVHCNDRTASGKLYILHVPVQRKYISDQDQGYDKDHELQQHSQYG